LLQHMLLIFLALLSCANPVFHLLEGEIPGFDLNSWRLVLAALLFSTPVGVLRLLIISVLPKAIMGVDCGFRACVLDSSVSPILDSSVSSSDSRVAVLVSIISPNVPIVDIVVPPSVSTRSKLTPFSKVATVDVDSLVATGQGKLDAGASGVPVLPMVREVSDRLLANQSGDGIPKSLQCVLFLGHLCRGGGSLRQGLLSVLSHN
jgi:hypothetical protein